MKNGVVASLLVVAILVGAGAGYFAGSSIRPTATTTSTMTTTQTVTMTVAQIPGTNALQLQLSLGLNGTGGVSVIVDDFNTLPATNNVTAGDRWLVTLSGLNGAPCGGEDSGWPVGFAIASGYYTGSNITAAKLLELVNPATTVVCPPYIEVFGDAVVYSFEPSSDVATGYGCSVNQCPTEAVTTGVSPSLWGDVAGYYNQAGTFTTFPRGTYTVLAEDKWGNYTLAYFIIS
jgi:hypothetical protein